MMSLVLRYILIFLLIVPEIGQYYGLGFFALFFINYLLFQVVSNIDPGFETKHPDLSFIELYSKYNGDFVCAYCEIKRPYHIKHCQHCNKCVRKFDHHCPWIHNCVGQNNHTIFFFFLLFTFLDFMYSYTVCFLRYWGLAQGSSLYSRVFPEELTGPIIEPVLLAIAVFCVLAFGLVTPLFLVQLTNLMKGTTTNERFAFNVLLT